MVLAVEEEDLYVVVCHPLEDELEVGHPLEEEELVVGHPWEELELG